MKYKFNIGDLVVHRSNRCLGMVMKRHAAHGRSVMYNRYEIKWLSEIITTADNWLCDFEYELKLVEEK